MSDIVGAKAISLVQAGGIVEKPHARTFVARGSGGGEYEVTFGTRPLGAVPRYSCTCPASGRCYHGDAAALLMAKRREEGERDHRVLDVRLTALADAIRSRDFERIEFEYDRVRSTLDRDLGVRERPSDAFRKLDEAGEFAGGEERPNG